MPKIQPLPSPGRRPQPARDKNVEQAAGEGRVGYNDIRTREVPAVRRASAILWLLARQPSGLTLSRVARDVDIIPSTCLHILRELIAARLVAYDRNAKLYRLGLGILLLARELRQQNPFIQAARSHLNRLAREFEVSAQATERDEDGNIVVVDAVIVIAGDITAVGGRTPALSGASGRLIAAYGGWSDAELQRHFKLIRWQNAPDFATWLNEVRITGGRRYAVDEGYFRKGITSIAGGIFAADGTIQRTISISIVSAQLDVRRRAALIEAVKSAAHEIAAMLA